MPHLMLNRLHSDLTLHTPNPFPNILMLLMDGQTGYSYFSALQLLLKHALEKRQLKTHGRGWNIPGRISCSSPLLAYNLICFLNVLQPLLCFYNSGFSQRLEMQMREGDTT